MPQEVDTRWNSYFDEILVMFGWVKDLQKAIFIQYSGALMSKREGAKLPKSSLQP